METNEIAAEVRAFIQANFNIAEDDEDFSDEVHLFDYGYINSFGAVELSTFLEERFDIQISDDDMISRSLNTIVEIAAFVDERQREGN